MSDELHEEPSEEHGKDLESEGVEQEVDSGEVTPHEPLEVDMELRGPILRYVDGILRHREENFGSIFSNRDTLWQIGMLLGIIVALSAFHGLSMGLKAGPIQMLSSGLKVPLLYLMTLGVCFPMLYVVNVIMGSRLGFLQTLALILLSMALNAILLAACTPIAIFFTITGSDYNFIKLLHVGIFAFSGLWGMYGLWRGLYAMCETSDLYPRQAVRILQIWIVIFAFVGSQMAWSLRPFIGAPDMKFQIFRDQESNFYQNVWGTMLSLSDGEHDRDEQKIIIRNN